MKRNQAIEKLALKKLDELSNEERAEQLEIMTLENWSESQGWNLLPKEIRNEFEDGETIQNPNAKKYNQVLLIWLKDGLQSVTNEFLIENLIIESVEGKPIELISCPCCGSRTIGERGRTSRSCWCLQYR